MLLPHDMVGMKQLSQTAYQNNQKFMQVMNRDAGYKSKIKLSILNNSHQESTNSTNLRTKNTKTLTNNTSISDYNIPQKKYVFFKKPESLEFQLQLYEQNKKYAPNKSYEPSIEIPKGYFYRYNEMHKKNYTPCLNYSKKNLYTQLSISHNKFTNSKTHNKSLVLSQSIIHKDSSKKLLLCKRAMLNNIVNKAQENFEDIKNDMDKSSHSIISSTKVKTITKAQSAINIQKIKQDFHLDELSNTVDENKLINKNYNKVKRRLDNKSQVFLKQIIQEISLNDSIIKRPMIVDYTYHNAMRMIKQRKEFSQVGNETFIMKRNYKGNLSVNPKNETKLFKKLIKGMMVCYDNDEDSLENFIKKKNVMKFMNVKKIKAKKI